MRTSTVCNLFHICLWSLFLIAVKGQDGFSRSACANTRTCISSPATCDPEVVNSCTYFASWKLSADKTKALFALYAKTNSYVAIGLSKSGGMHSSDVYACTARAVVVRSLNINHSNLKQDLKGVSDESVTAADGIIMCEFSRSLTLNEADVSFYDLSPGMSYTATMAWDGGLNDDGSLQRHTGTNRVVEQTKITFGEASPTEPPVGDGSGGGRDGCGTTRSCFSSPENCDPTSAKGCNAFSSWTYDAGAGTVQIALSSTASSYIAIGFSKSGGMDNTDVYACTSNMLVRRSRNDGMSNSAQEEKGISNERVTVSNGVITCSFARLLKLEDGDDTFFDLSSGNSYTVLLAWGNSLNNDGEITKHVSRDRSSEPIDLTEMLAIGGTGESQVLAQFHGALMTLAWLGFASIGITSARFFKPVWPGQEIFGVKVWFMIHRTCMVSCVACFLLAFIFILIDAKGYIDIGGGALIIRSFHAIFGTLVIVLGLLNVTMALFRPHPGDPRRNMFNWAHWSIGTTAHLFSLFTILMGTVNNPGQMVYPLLSSIKPFVFWIVLVFVIFHIIMWIAFTLLGLKTAVPTYQPQNDIALDTAQTGSQGDVSTDLMTPPDQNDESLLKRLLFYCYVGTVSVVVVIVIIGMFV